MFYRGDFAKVASQNHLNGTPGAAERFASLQQDFPAIKAQKEIVREIDGVG